MIPCVWNDIKRIKEVPDLFWCEHIKQSRQSKLVPENTRIALSHEWEKGTQPFFWKLKKVLKSKNNVFPKKKSLPLNFLNHEKWLWKRIYKKQISYGVTLSIVLYFKEKLYMFSMGTKYIFSKLSIQAFAV